MKTILKITFVCIAAFAFNSANAQSALDSRKITKVEAKSEVKSKEISQEKVNTGGMKTTAVEERQEANPQTINVAKQVNNSQTPGTAKTPAQMSRQPLKKETVGKAQEQAPNNQLK